MEAVAEVLAPSWMAPPWRILSQDRSINIRAIATADHNSHQVLQGRMGDHGSPNPGFRDLSHQVQAVPILFIAPGGQLVHLDHIPVDIGSSDKEDGIVGQGGHGEIRYADGGRRRGGHLVAVMHGGVAQGVRNDVKGRVVAGSGSCRSENRHRMNTELPRPGCAALEEAYSQQTYWSTAPPKTISFPSASPTVASR
jgi:hypothetical protein